MRVLIIPLLLFTISWTCQAQDGPGGVGSTNGKSSLLLWLDADYVKQDSGVHVGLWLDRSGHGNHAVPESGIGPKFTQDFNSKRGVINFDSKWGEHLIIPDNALMSPDELSLYVVGKISEESESWAGFVLKETGANWENGYGIGRNDTLKEFIGFTTDFETNGIKAPFEYNEWNLVSLHHGNSVLEFLAQGESQGVHNAIDSITRNRSSLWIGWTGSHLDGRIAEIIMFNKRNSKVERRLIENYLATKYLLSIEGDLYPFEDEGYNNDLNGFGQELDGSRYISSGGGSGIVCVDAPSDLNNGEFFLWANKELSWEETKQLELPSGVPGCLNKIWRISETNLSGLEADIGNVNVVVDLSEYHHLDLRNVVMLIDVDNDGSFLNDTPLSSKELMRSGKFQFSNVSHLKHGVRFTFGTASSQTENGFDDYVKYFQTEIIDSLIYLRCKVAKVVQGAEFLVEKSNNEGKFQLVEKITGESILDSDMEFSTNDAEAKLGYTIYRLLHVMKEGDTVVLAHCGFDYDLAMHDYSDWIIEDQRRRMNQEMEKSQDYLKIMAMYIVIVLVIIFIVACYFRRRYANAKHERDLLLQQISDLKMRGVALSVSEPGNRKALELDKLKIEKVIESKLGESAWMILNLIFEDPSISNKEIAENVSLSIEGVSSSLRRMYTIFDITTSSNKKIALIMKASEISSNSI